LRCQCCKLLASSGSDLRAHCQHVSSSVKFVWRAQLSHAVRSPASVTVICFRSVRRLQMRSLRRYPAEGFRVRAQASPLRLSASPPKLHPRRVPSRLTSRSSRPRVVASAMCFTLRLHMSAAPPQGGLTPALGPTIMSIANSRIGWLLALASPILFGCGYYFAWNAGCLFDAKQGIGDFHSSSSSSLVALVSTATACLALALAVPLIWRPTIPAFIGSLLFFGILAAPIGILMLLAAEASGVRACGP